jgi:DNA sulfur modification protein DndC
MEARRYALSVVLGVQGEINISALRSARPEVSLINEEEATRIKELIAANTWPQKWSGEEPVGDVLLDKVYADGSLQPLLGEF